MEKILLNRKGAKFYSKPIRILSLKELKSLNPLSFKILNFLSKEQDYPNELAKKLKIHEQKVYYHIHNLEKAGLIKVIREEKRQGALCKFYAPTSKAFGIELEETYEEGKEKKEKEMKIDSNSFEKIKLFFSDFISSGIFDGSIVVGSPTSHGPFLTSARDGHYAIQLSMFLGNFCSLTKRFVVKLDTEVKAEKAEKRNMIIIGGPVTNMITSEINDKLKIRFKYDKSWQIFSEEKNRYYNDEELGIIAKIKNPYDQRKMIILLAGLKYEGTKSCIIALTQYFDKLLKNYSSGEFFALIRGLDRDGDNKVDDIEIVEIH